MVTQVVLRFFTVNSNRKNKTHDILKLAVKECFRWSISKKADDKTKNLQRINSPHQNQNQKIIDFKLNKKYNQE